MSSRSPSEPEETAVSASHCHVRAATAADLCAITCALAWAIDWRSQETSDPAQLIDATGHAYLLAGWGRAGDTAVIAETAHGRPVGSAWFRYWNDELHSYGYVAPDCPELGIGVDPRYRRSGIGGALLGALVEAASRQGIGRLSLSVESDNPAIRLYQQHGFVRCGLIEASWTMVRELEADRRAGQAG